MFRGYGILACLVFLGSPAFAQPFKVNNSSFAAERIQEFPTLASPVPTSFNLMPARYVDLVEAVAGYERTGVPMVAFDGKKFSAVAYNDDPGIAYAVLGLSTALHWSVAKCVDMYLIMVLSLATISSLVGVLKLCKHPLGKLASVTGIVGVAIASARTGDVYCVQSAVAIAAVPWLLYFNCRKPTRGLLPFALIIGFIAGSANLVRNHSGTAVLLFAAVLLLTGKRIVLRGRVAIAVFALFGFTVPTLASTLLTARRDAYLRSVDSTYQARAAHHIFWHTVYIGFGFLQNPYGIMYLDESAIEKVKSIDPTLEYSSPRYERVLRNEVFRFVAKHPWFSLYTFAAKFGVLLTFLLIGANVGLIAACKFRKARAIDAAFAIGCFFCAIQGWLAVPLPKYVLGLVAFSVLWGVISIDYALCQNVLDALGSWFVCRRTTHESSVQRRDTVLI